MRFRDCLSRAWVVDGTEGLWCLGENGATLPITAHESESHWRMAVSFEAKSDCHVRLKTYAAEQVCLVRA